ncbi:hypothetical protein SUGI_1139400 [Cryptomeria japonica]|nr:hypothetical protein SUGI_1139400 [Cryptomeria japonica]
MGNGTYAGKKFMILFMVVVFVAGTIMVEADTSCDCIMCGSVEFCCGAIDSNVPPSVCTTCMSCGTTQYCCAGSGAPAPSPSLWSSQLSDLH